MSLINEMLRDLEARGGNEPDAQVRSAPATRVPPRMLWPLFALGTLVVALAVAIVVLSRPAPESIKPVAATLTEMERDPAPARATETAAPNEPAAAAALAASPPVSAGEESEIAALTQLPPIAIATETETPEPEPVIEKAPKVAIAKTEKVEAVTQEAESVIVRRHEPTQEEVAARAGRDGFVALRNGDWATAARLLQELVAFEAANDDAREGLVVALTRQGRIAEADGALIDGMAVGAVPARFAKLRARLQAARGELDAALDSLAIAVPPVSVDPEYHALKGALAQQAERYDMAADIYAVLTAFEPANGTWQAGLGMALDQSGDIESAREAYARALTAGQLEPALLAHVQRRASALSDQER